MNSKSIITGLVKKVKVLEQTINEMGLSVKTARKKKFPRKTKPINFHSMNRALCVETSDPKVENRIRFYHPILHEPDTPIKGLPFAKPISAMGGFDDCGLVWVPPAGSTVAIVFENGQKHSPFYMGTTWHRNRGDNGRDFGYTVREYDEIYSGKRGGYFDSSLDNKQALPQWNTENYNVKDFDTDSDFIKDVDAQKKATYPNIYGFKTPEKHMLKMVDGNAKCNRRWKRVELMSGCGNWLLMKDDHLHYGGQWAHPSCPPNPGGQDLALCSEHSGDKVYFTDFLGKPIEKDGNCGTPLLGGPASNPLEPTRQKGANPNFKHKNECRPYKGPGTPQNNKCNLPQSGIQMLSISGHTWVFDDSVEEPKGKPTWDRSMQDFDFGCTDKYLGRIYMKSATGHKFEMSDIEESKGVRGNKNYIELLSAAGNKIQLNDHTQGNNSSGSMTTCPPNYAGPERGIHLQSTSNHQINMVDHKNQQCSPMRMEGGTPTPKATEAYLQARSGYGHELMFNDVPSQEKTLNQYIQLTHPQCVDPKTDDTCNGRGPHFLRFQGRPNGQPGVIFLRAGGHSVRSTYDKDVVLVGDKEKNPSDKFTYVSKNNISACEQNDFRYAGELHIMFAEKRILLQAGRDCPPKAGKKCCGPCLFPVVVGKCPVICPVTGIVHWTELSLSERVFASAYPLCPGILCGGDASKGCRDDESEEDIDTGAGVVRVGNNAG